MLGVFRGLLNAGNLIYEDLNVKKNYGEGDTQTPQVGP